MGWFLYNSKPCKYICKEKKKLVIILTRPSLHTRVHDYDEDNNKKGNVPKFNAKMALINITSNHILHLHMSTLFISIFILFFSSNEPGSKQTSSTQKTALNKYTSC